MHGHYPIRQNRRDLSRPTRSIKLLNQGMSRNEITEDRADRRRRGTGLIIEERDLC